MNTYLEPIRVDESSVTGYWIVGLSRFRGGAPAKCCHRAIAELGFIGTVFTGLFEGGVRATAYLGSRCIEKHLSDEQTQWCEDHLKTGAQTSLMSSVMSVVLCVQNLTYPQLDVHTLTGSTFPSFSTEVTGYGPLAPHPLETGQAT